MNQDSVRERFAEWIGRRGQGGMSEMAQFLEITPQYLSQWRAGKKRLGQPKLTRLQQKLDEMALQTPAAYADPVDAINRKVARDLTHLLTDWNDSSVRLKHKLKATQGWIAVFQSAYEEYVRACEED